MRGTMHKRGVRPAAMLILLALLALPGVGAAQVPPPPPHEFVGSAADATVDGAPLEPGTLLEAVDADGNVIATAT